MPSVTWRNIPIPENVKVKPNPVTATVKKVIKNRSLQNWYRLGEGYRYKWFRRNFSKKVDPEKGMYCFAFSKFGACTRSNYRYMHVNENAAYPNYSSKRDAPQSPGYHVPRHKTKGPVTKGTVNRYQPL